MKTKSSLKISSMSLIPTGILDERFIGGSSEYFKKNTCSSMPFSSFVSEYQPSLISKAGAGGYFSVTFLATGLNAGSAVSGDFDAFFLTL